MDWGSLIGITLAVGGLLIGQKLEGGTLGSLIQPAAFIIVIVGTMGAVLLQSGLQNFMTGIGMARRVFRAHDDQFPELMRTVVDWSITARREGLLSLEKRIPDAKDPFIAHGLRLIVDGIEPRRIREVLDMEIGVYETKQRLAAKIWEAAGGYAPTIGILGAVLGLIHVMENLSDPERLGSGIAIAFVATIYGVGFANLVFLPISNKLKALVNRDVFRHELLAEAFAGIAAGDNPRLIEERMAIYLL
ncbi:MAG: flagellar motor protein [Oxalicibacterium faecigallinarum]|uniref:Flagellar motor protein n=1 Tax=Oxalicibacterium faecigallinarum TaxID=573741 RepID=A0A8J3ASU0_9BURK|nr:flagellar motor protein [Oxalicibacterium faecigallinarum]MDQ7970543.1 flagellar motor protein [Oxalicibacterium faecigallinarum]GGI16262.1 flagellar motor protein [Oxalicibacterium faecigallinarum]